MITRSVIEHSEKNIYYRNVHVFIERVRQMIIILSLELVRRNLSFCLRETALDWHISKLIEDNRRLLIYEEEVDEWARKLVERFKKSFSTIMIILLRERYDMNDARKNREPRKYAQIIIRTAKSIEIISIFNQLYMIYNELNVKFQRDLVWSTQDTILNSLDQQLNDNKKIWWTLERKNHLDQSNSFTFNNNISSSDEFYRSEQSSKEHDSFEDNLQSQMRKSYRSNNASYYQTQSSYSRSQIQFFYSYQNKAYESYQSYSPNTNSFSNVRALHTSSQKQITFDSANNESSFRSGARTLFQVSNQFENRERYSSQRAYFDDEQKHSDADEQISENSENNEFEYYDHEDYWVDYISSSQRSDYWDRYVPSGQRSDYEEVDYDQHVLKLIDIAIVFEPDGED